MMTNATPNKNIGCVVTECKFHAGNEDYCTLNHIHVSKHEATAKSIECTDCASFEAEQKSSCCSR